MLYTLTFSPTGGTQKAANCLAQGLAESFTALDLMDRYLNLSRLTFTPEDCCLVAVPSFGGRVPAPAVRRLQALTGNGARAVLLAVYGNRDYDDTLLELEEVLVQAGFRPVAAVAAVAEHSLLPQFAAGRPDQADQAQLRAFGQAIRRRLEEGSPEELSLPGHRPYRPYAGVPMKPKATRACTACGLCAATCPVGAIPRETPRQTDKGKCISCMACAARCPQKARRTSRLMAFAAGRKLKAACAGRKENQLF